MTDKEFDENAQVPDPSNESAEGSGAEASGPEPDELTVDDILNAEQTAEAASAEDEAAAEADAASDAASTGEGSPENDREADLLNDLKRVQAEYANYRRRTEDQRQSEIERAKGEAAKGLLPVLDDLDRAAQHGDLVEGSPFFVIAEKLRGVVERLGVVAYGAKDDEFNPQDHEAIFQQPTPGVDKPVILEVVEVGYRLGDVELRPAKVVVAVPAE